MEAAGQQEELSDSESGSEPIEISDLKQRMWKDQMLLNKQAAGPRRRVQERGGGPRRAVPAQGDAPGSGRRAPAHAQDDGGLQRARFRVRSHRRGRRAHVGVLRQPARVVEGQRGLRPVRAHGADDGLASCLHRLQDIQDSTLGSVLSADPGS
jgi:ethylene-insensitive protein 3